MNKPKEAIEVLKEFLKAWKKGDFKTMYQKSQKTYKAVHRQRKEADMECFLGSKKLTGYKIGEPVKLGTAMIEFPVEICWFLYEQQKERFQKRIKVRLIKEIEAYKTSDNGSWGVNPISAYKEEEITEVKNEG